jgi:hypothetical protein
MKFRKITGIKIKLVKKKEENFRRNPIPKKSI